MYMYLHLLWASVSMPDTTGPPSAIRRGRECQHGGCYVRCGRGGGASGRLGDVITTVNLEVKKEVVQFSLSLSLSLSLCLSLCLSPSLPLLPPLPPLTCCAGKIFCFSSYSVISSENIPFSSSTYLCSLSLTSGCHPGESNVAKKLFMKYMYVI